MAACPNCGALTSPDLRFCLNCGTALAQRCPTCATARVPGARFCGNCGTRFGDAEVGGRPAAGPSAGDASGDGASGGAIGLSAERGSTVQIERRLVSVLFTDLVGFTTHSERSDPEVVREYLTRYFDAAAQVMARYGGTIEKFIGDAVMAVWGTPVAFEDDAERAVRAALDLIEAVHALGPIGQGPDASAVDIRAAVMTGEAAVTVGASGQGMVAGDLVNSCSRLQGAADPGTVLVDEATYRGAREAVAFEPAGERNLRGKTLPLPAWRALRVVAERGGVGRAEGLEAPFVGREEELRLLKEQLHATGREGRARLVTIFGQPGMGKSRLVWEFQKYVDGVMENIYWHEGRSPSYGEGIAYWALGEMVRRRAGINESEPEATARPKLRESVARWVQDETERPWIEQRLAALLGLADAPSGDREELFAAWRRYFEGIAAEGTTVLLFEDLHWADQALLDFIESLLEWSRGKPILVIGLARPELTERRPSWGVGGRASVALHLEPVSFERVADMLAGLAPGLPQEAIAHIAERSEGVPLFAVETVRMLLDEGRLVRDGERFRLVDADKPFAVPPSLHALIAARLDALEPDDRGLIQDAAVLGKSFTVEGVAAVSGADPETTEVRLRSLGRKELVELDTDPRSPERGQYRFVHGLFREIAYGTLSHRVRRARHLAAARYFEALGDDELTGVLASHYLDAYRAAPDGPEGEAVVAQARIALRAAVDRSLSLHAHATALEFIEEALSVTTDPHERAALWVRASEPAEAALGHATAEAYLRQAFAFYDAEGDLNGLKHVTIRLSQVLLPSSRVDEAIEVLTEMAGRLPQMTDRLDAQLCNELARAYCFRDQGELAFEAAERGLAIAERLGLEAEVAELFITKSWVADLLGRAREAAVLAQGGLHFATRVGNSSSQVRARMNLSNWQMTDDPRAGMETAAAGMEIARRAGLHLWVVRIAGNWGSCALLCGEWATLLDTYAELDSDRLDMATLLSLAGGAAHAEAMLGRGRHWRERLDAMQASAEESASYQDRAGYVAFRIMAAYAEADYERSIQLVNDSIELAGAGEALIAAVFACRGAFWLGRPDDAAQAVEVLDTRGDTGSWMTGARRHLRALRALHDGDLAAAETDVRDALALFRRLDLPSEVAVALIDLRRIIGADHPEAAAIEAEVGDISLRLGAPSLGHRLAGAPMDPRRTRPAASRSGSAPLTTQSAGSTVD